ncbi:TPA: hypothetical protein ACGPU7_004752, partial [Escherichia coli]
GTCHPCLLHPPGGIIDCDGEFITTRGGHGHPPLITVPGGSRFYRSSGAESLQYQHLNLAPQSAPVTADR